MLSIIVSTLFVSLLLNVILKKFNLPTLIGYIFTGTIIAYSFNLHEAVHNHELKEIAEFGVVFLMFTIGLEFSIEHLKRMKYEVFVVGSLQIFLSVSVVYVLSYYVLSIEQMTAFIISLAVALSSTAIVLKTFNETGEISRRYGQRSLGILIMQDIAVIPILLIIGFMSNRSDDISSVLLGMLLSAIFLLTLLWFIGKYLLEPFFTQIVKTNSDELFVTTILFLAIGASYIAHVLGFSYSLGAFIAGMLIAETKFKHQAEADLTPFRDLLLGIFFITVGMQIDFVIVFSYLHIIVVFLVAIMLLKFMIIFLLIKINENRRTALKTALSLVQVGEFSLALLELAKTNELIGSSYSQVMIVIIVLSMILTPIILKNLTFVSDFFCKNEGQILHSEFFSEDIKDHTIILGFGEFGQNVAQTLKAHEEPYIAIENNIDSFYKSHKSAQPIIFGNAAKKEVLKGANLNAAKKVIVAVNNQKKLYHICDTVLKTIDNSNKIIVKVHSNREKEIIANLGIANIVVENDLASEEISRFVIEN